MNIMSFVGNSNPNNDHQVVVGRVPHFQDENDRHNVSSDSSTVYMQNSPYQLAGSMDGLEKAHSQDIEAQETARREHEVLELARKLTIRSHQSASHHQSPFSAAEGSSLDPKSSNFNARAWTKAMMNLQLSDDNAAPTRSAGIAFCNLNVHGYGADTDYQKSVGNVWLEGPSLIKRLRGDKGRKINILQGLDGLVESGEMLVVLGPPGSGCSTFLKTITGETHGFFVDENSKLNYQGELGVSPSFNLYTDWE